MKFTLTVRCQYCNIFIKGSQIFFLRNCHELIEFNQRNNIPTVLHVRRFQLLAQLVCLHKEQVERVAFT